LLPEVEPRLQSHQSQRFTCLPPTPSHVFVPSLSWHLGCVVVCLSVSQCGFVAVKMSIVSGAVVQSQSQSRSRRRKTPVWAGRSTDHLKILASKGLQERASPRWKRQHTGRQFRSTKVFERPWECRVYSRVHDDRLSRAPRVLTGVEASVERVCSEAAPPHATTLGTRWSSYSLLPL